MSTTPPLPRPLALPAHALIDSTGLHPMSPNLRSVHRQHADPWTADRVLQDAYAGMVNPRAGGRRRTHATGTRPTLTYAQHHAARRIVRVLTGAEDV